MYVVPPLSPSTHFHCLLCTWLTQLHPIKNLFCKILNCDYCHFSPCHLICVGGSDGRTLTGLQESGNCTPTIKGYICGAAENISKFHAIYVYGPISIQFQAKLEENQSIGGGCKISVMVLEVMLLSWQLKRPR